MGILSTREWATVIWGIFLFLYVILNKSRREQLGEIGKIFFCKKLLAFWGADCLYILGITLMLSKLPCWKNIYIKDIVFWFFGSGLIYCINALSNEADEKFIRKILKESFHFTIIFEFIVNTFTFNIWIELAIIPITTILIVMKTFVDQKKNYKDLQKLLNIILALGGFLAFGATFIVGLHEYRKLNIFDTFVSFAIPFIYLVLIIPLVYSMVLISKYEFLFVNMSSKENKDRKARRKHRIIIVNACKFSIYRVLLFQKKYVYKMYRNMSELEFKNLMKEFHQEYSGK